MNKDGSCLVTVVLLISLISFFCLHLWRITVSMFDVSVAKQQYLQQSSLASGLLTWGIDLCIHNFDTLVEYNNSHKSGLIVVTSPEGFPTVHLPKLEGNIVFTNGVKNNHYCIYLTAKLLRKKNMLMQLTCRVYKEYDADKDVTHYRISKWRLQNKA